MFGNGSDWQVIECLRPRVYGAGDFIIYEGDEGPGTTSW